jgi:hypothetical protein
VHTVEAAAQITTTGTIPGSLIVFVVHSTDCFEGSIDDPEHAVFHRGVHCGRRGDAPRDYRPQLHSLAPLCE